MRTSGPRRSPRPRAERPPSDSARVLARHVRQSVGVVGRARGRRRARLTARHGRGVRALPVRALPGDGRVQRGAAGAAQPAAARAAAGSVLSVSAAGAPLRRGGARAAAALCTAGGARARGALRAAAAGAAAASTTGVLRAGLQASAASPAQVLRASVPRGHRGLAATVPLRGVRGRGGGAPAGLHSAAAAATRAPAALRAPGAPVLRPGSQTTTTST